MRFAALVTMLAHAVTAATLAYVDPTGALVYQTGGAKPKVVAAHNGFEPSLRRDGRQIVYTRQVNDRGGLTLVLYDVASGSSSDLISGFVRSPLWSPDGSRVAFLRMTDKWRVWTMNPADPATAVPLSALEVKTLVGWTPSGDAIAAYDNDNIHWIGRSGQTIRSVSFEQVYGKQLEWTSGNQLRIHPVNPDLISLSAYVEDPRSEDPLTPVIMLFDLKTQKRTPVLGPDNWGQDTNWSPDGAWLYFSHGEGRGRSGIWRVRPDGSGLERVISGGQPDVSR